MFNVLRPFERLPKHSGDKMSIKHSDIGCRVCAYAHVVRKSPWCTLIGACEVNRTNTVIISL